MLAMWMDLCHAQATTHTAAPHRISVQHREQIRLVACAYTDPCSIRTPTHAPAGQEEARERQGVVPQLGVARRMQFLPIINNFTIDKPRTNQTLLPSLASAYVNEAPNTVGRTQFSHLLYTSSLGAVTSMQVSPGGAINRKDRLEGWGEAGEESKAAGGFCRLPPRRSHPIPNKPRPLPPVAEGLFPDVPSDTSPCGAWTGRPAAAQGSMPTHGIKCCWSLLSVHTSTNGVEAAGPVPSHNKQRNGYDDAAPLCAPRMLYLNFHV